MATKPQRASYVVHLRIEVSGPDTDWREVAERLARRVQGMRHNGLTVVEVQIDESEEEHD